MIKQLIAVGLALVLTGMNITPAWAVNPDEINITVNISNSLSVNIQNTDFAHGSSQALGADFVLAQSQVLSIDNDSGAGSTGYVETYQLSAAIQSPVAWQTPSLNDDTAGQDDLALLAVFSAAGSLQPAPSEFGADDDVLDTAATTATDSVYYGPVADDAKDGDSVVPATNAERNLWLRIKLPTSSTVSATSTVIRLFVNALQG